MTDKPPSVEEFEKLAVGKNAVRIPADGTFEVRIKTPLPPKWVVLIGDYAPEHSVVLIEGSWRWVVNPVIRMLVSRVSLNDIWRDWEAWGGELEDIMGLYQQIGYSLAGFDEIFGHRVKEREAAKS